MSTETKAIEHYQMCSKPHTHPPYPTIVIAIRNEELANYKIERQRQVVFLYAYNNKKKKLRNQGHRRAVNYRNLAIKTGKCIRAEKGPL